MISEELKGIVDKFKEQGKMDFLEETTEEKILSFEKEKGVTLPSKYKDWLLFSDGGELFLPAGIQLYGVEHKPLIDVNDNSRPSEDYVVIGGLASGDPILFKKDSDKIAIYNQGAGRIEDDEIYDNFVAFFPLRGGYKHLFRISNTKKYKAGTSFEEIVSLYKFDVL